MQTSNIIRRRTHYEKEMYLHLLTGMSLRRPAALDRLRQLRQASVEGADTRLICLQLGRDTSTSAVIDQFEEETGIQVVYDRV